MWDQTANGDTQTQYLCLTDIINNDKNIEKTPFDICGIIPTVCQDRKEDKEYIPEYLHGDSHLQHNFTESDDDFIYDDDLIDIDKVALMISKGYEDIRASNPNIISSEDRIDTLIARDSWLINA